MRHLSTLAAVLLVPPCGAGAQTAPKPFSIVIVPDTQHYHHQFQRDGMDILSIQTRWLRAAREQFPPLAFVTQVGDVTNDGLPLQWAFASTAFQQLDESDQPYSVTFGNHDSTAPGPFAPPRYAGKIWFAGASADGLATAQTFDAGGTAFVHVNLPCGPKPAHFEFASAVLTKYLDRAAIISTHAYLRHALPGRDEIGQLVWNQLVERHPQVFLVCCGHNWFSRHEIDTTEDRRKILQVQCDFQHSADGGGGFLQCLGFDPAAGRIALTTYSPFSGASLHDPDHQRDFSATFFPTRVVMGDPTGRPCRQWTGNPGGGKWSDPANWKDGAPREGDTLLLGVACGPFTNDLPANITLGGIIFGMGATPAAGIAGNAVRLRGQLTHFNTGQAKTATVINLPIELIGPCEISPGDRLMELTQPLSGTGDLIKTLGRDAVFGSFDGEVGEGMLTLTAESTHTGITEVWGGVLKLACPSSPNGLAKSSRIILRRGSMLDVTAQSDHSLTLAPGQELTGMGGTLNGNLLMDAKSVCAIPPAGFLTVCGLVSLGNARLRTTETTIQPLSVQPGDRQCLISNDGDDPVKGVFTDAAGKPIPEDGEVTPNANITYRGGDGNDIELILKPAP